MTHAEAADGAPGATPGDAQRLREAMGWTRSEMAAFLGLTPSAYAYRLRSGKLRSEEAMRVEMLESVLEEAVRVLHGEEEGVEWLQGNILSLEGRRPVDLLVSVRGYERVKNTLAKIEYGMY